MKFSAAILAAAVGVSAHGYGNDTIPVVTETVSSIVTYCPGPTEITHGSKTYTVTEATTLTITDCPCTITRPVTTSSVVACTTCAPPPVYNTSMVVPTPPPTGGVTPTGPGGPVVTAGAGKAAALSGAGLAGIVGFAAFVL